jgi:hypothetical protein
MLVPLRPQGPIEVVDRATLLLRQRFSDFITISLTVHAPIWFVLALVLRDQWAGGLEDNQAFVWLALFPDPITLGLLADRAAEEGPIGIVLARALPSFGLAVIGAASGVLVSDWSRGRPTRGADALKRVARRLHVLAALWTIVHAIEIVTCVGTVLGPLVFGVSAPLWAMEGLGPWSAVARSWRLSIRQLGRLCLSIPVATIVSAMTGALLGLLALPLILAFSGGWVDLGGTGVTALAAALPHLVLDPLLAASMALIALDLKVQTEGHDLRVELAESEGSVAAGA